MPARSGILVGLLKGFIEALGHQKTEVGTEGMERGVVSPGALTTTGVEKVGE